MPLFTSKVRYANGLRGEGWATPEYYGAKHDTGVNDLAVFQTAVNDLAVTGGKLRLGPYTYRLDGLLTLPSSVSWEGVPDATYVQWNHATANRMVFTQTNQGNPATFKDLRFIGGIAGTGTFAVNNADARVLFERCTWNGFDSGGGPTDFLRGRIASLNSSDSEMTFLNCRIDMGTDGVKGLNVPSGKIRMEGGIVNLPATYYEDFAYSDTSGLLELDNVYFNLTNHTTNTMKVLYAPSSAARASMTNCVLDAGGASGGLILGFHWVPGARILAKGNQPIGSSAILIPYGGSSAAVGSVIENFNYTNGAGSNTATIPTFCDTYVFRGVSTTPSFTLPTNAVKYQRLRMHIYNASGGNWSSFGIGVPAIAPIPSLVNGAVCMAEFQYTDMFVPGTFQWVMMGINP